MISLDGEFVFIHINKTAGTSVETALKQRFSVTAGERHYTALSARERLGDERFRRFFKFSVVRNPFDRMVSLYHYRQSRWRAKTGRGADQFSQSFTEFVRDIDARDFSTASAAERTKRLLFARGDQLHWLTDAGGEPGFGAMPFGDPQGEILVDFVARFENLADDWKTICRRLGVEVELPHVKSSDHAPFASYYDAESRAIVARLFARDIARLGYAFPGA